MDSVPAVVTVTHRSNNRRTSAFRYIHSYIYSTEFFYFDGSNPNNVIFLFNGVARANFTSGASIVNDTGSVPFPVDEKEALVTILPILLLILTDEVMYRATYTVRFEVEWHSLPYGYPGGRAYSDTGTITYRIKDIQMAIADATSNVLTLNRDLQLQEIVFCNVTVTFPEVIKMIIVTRKEGASVEER